METNLGTAVEQPLRSRRIGGVEYTEYWTAPRVVIEGLYRTLLEQKIPAVLETPFTQSGLPEAYLGTYFGDTTLWIAAEFYRRAEYLISQGDLSLESSSLESSGLESEKP